MGLRAYFLVTVRDDCKAGAFSQAVDAIEAVAEVDFADPVVGAADVVVMVESDNIETAANKVAELSCVENVSILKVVSVLERHRSSKQELLKKLAKQKLT